MGSSFAFIAGYAAIAPNGEADLLPYACLGVACSGLLYLVLSALFKVFGPKRVMRLDVYKRQQETIASVLNLVLFGAATGLALRRFGRKDVCLLYTSRCV